MPDFDTAPYEGHDFVHGRVDCLTTIRAAFADHHGVHIRDYARPDWWWNNDLNLYRELADREGFTEIRFSPHTIRTWDIFLIALKSEVPNHGAIYVGDGKILHHPPGRRSEVEDYVGLWRDLTIGVLRHRSLMGEPTPTVVDFRELDLRSFAANEGSRDFLRR